MNPISMHHWTRRVAPLMPLAAQRASRVWFSDVINSSAGDLPKQSGGFRHLVESSGDAMMVIRLDGTVAYANPAASRLFNRDAVEMCNEPFGLPLTKGGIARVDVLPRGRAPAVADMRVVETHWDGQPAKLASLRDVTKRVEMERSLNLSAIIFNQAAEGIALVDHHLRLVEVNAAFAHFFGGEPKTYAGRDLVSMFDSAEEERRLIEALRALGPGQRWRGEIKLAGTDLEPDRFVLVSAVHVVEEEDFAAHFVLLCTDISRQKQDQFILRHEARHDGLTGLPNRVSFRENLHAALARASRKRTVLAVMFVDLDGFKLINDQHGHERGDRLLEEVARRMRAVVRAGDIVARMGGDEFTLLLEDIEDPADVAAVADKLRTAIEQPVALGDITLHVRTSIGASLYPDNGETADELLDRADLALYRVKERDPGGFRFFNANMDRRSRLHREMAARLTTALRSDALRLVFQPQVDIDTGAVHSVEALLRYPGSSVGWRRPQRLVELAEQVRLLPELLHWVLSRAMQAARNWPDAPSVAINLCSPQLLVADLDERIAKAAEQAGLPLSRVLLHLPMGGVMTHPEQATVLAARLRRRGIKTYLDNFGNGDFSVVALESLALDGVCVDRSLIAGMLDSAERCLTLKALLAMLKAMELPVVVQGVSHQDQLDWLRRMAGGLAVQGEQIAIPLSQAEVLSWLSHR